MAFLGGVFGERDGRSRARLCVVSVASAVVLEKKTEMGEGRKFTSPSRLDVTLHREQSFRHRLPFLTLAEGCAKHAWCAYCC